MAKYDIDTTPPLIDADVARAFSLFPLPERRGLLSLRTHIYEVAQTTDGVGVLHETLKWGQPSYLTPETKAGSTIRLGLQKGGGYALFAHCRTTIISEFRDMFPSEFQYQGNRAVLFPVNAEPWLELRSILIRRALSYHL